MGRGVLLTSNLPQLQNLIKRDPISYKEEFLQQWNHYNSIREIFRINPGEQAQHFRELVTFISQVSTCYPKETAEFPSQLSSLLLESYNVLFPDTRKTLVQNLVMLRNKNVISSIQLLKSLFPLLPRTTSSSLRLFIRKTILSDIRTANIRTKNHKLNRAVQAMLFGMVERGAGGEIVGDKGKNRVTSTDRSVNNGEDAMWAIILTKELWRKGTWTDAKSVSIIAQGCSHPVTKVQSASVHFFLGSEEEQDDSDDEEQDVDVRALHHRREINKKTRSGDKKLNKQLKSAKKKRTSKTESTPNFPAIQLLHDPQTFAETLYDILNNYDKRFSLDRKILLMQLLSRVMGAHKLCVLSFYTYIVKYLTHRQLRVPSILVALAQSVHELTPPDAVTPVIRKLAQEFVHPGVASEVIAAGLNSIREVCRRQPWAMEEDLLGDLVEYRKSRDKSVTSAARGLLKLYREVNPGLLKRRERGKDASMGIASGKQPLPYGHNPEAAVDIEGLSLLEDHLQKLRKEGNTDNSEDDETAWNGWDVESDSSEDDSDSEEEWINVDEDDDDLVVSDSEDEKEGQNSAMSGEDSGPSRISTLVTTKILTPADFALLNDLRIQAASKAVESGGGSKTKRKLAALGANKASVGFNQDIEDSFISENDILGPRKKAKADYAERMASIQKGREGREKFGSNKGKQNKAVPSSSTNREKARNKPIMMILSSGAVRGKKKASLREKQQKLRAHIEKSKKTRH
ncbi:protein required for actin cytoskeleton organization and cell cycle progression [Cyathus striatus]|nr:protein required for actin cytoskeleton organization and cell cycle progression [Cyathus striatus]